MANLKSQIKLILVKDNNDNIIEITLVDNGTGVNYKITEFNKVNFILSKLKNNLTQYCLSYLLLNNYIFLDDEDIVLLARILWFS